MESIGFAYKYAVCLIRYIYLFDEFIFNCTRSSLVGDEGSYEPNVISCCVYKKTVQEEQ